MEGFDAASVVSASRFIASGSQPFVAAEALTALEAPTLLVRGEDPMHPPEVSELYATSIPDCTTMPASANVAQILGPFVDRCLRATY